MQANIDWRAGSRARFGRSSLLTGRFDCWHPDSPLSPTGLVFLAFGFNWVDVGGLLGGRLDEDIVRVPARATITAGSGGSGAKAGRRPEMVKRAHTM